MKARKSNRLLAHTVVLTVALAIVAISVIPVLHLLNGEPIGELPATFIAAVLWKILPLFVGLNALAWLSDRLIESPLPFLASTFVIAALATLLWFVCFYLMLLGVERNLFVETGGFIEAAAIFSILGGLTALYFAIILNKF